MIEFIAVTIIAVIFVTALFVYLKLEKFAPHREKLKQSLKACMQKCGESCCKRSKKVGAESLAVKQPESSLPSQRASAVDTGPEKCAAVETAAETRPETVPAGAAICEAAAEEMQPAVQEQLSAAAESEYRPTDSILRRHYESMLAGRSDKVQAEEMEKRPEVQEERPFEVAVEEIIDEIEESALTEAAPCTEECGKLSVPEDSILRRHFLATLRAGIEAAVGPRPTDSILRRHYDSLIDCELRRHLGEPAVCREPCGAEPCAETPNLAADVTAAEPMQEQVAMQPEVQEQRLAAAAAEVPVEEIAVTGAAPSVAASRKQAVPQDPILRKHFLTALRAGIEAGIGPRPTDSILQRHYDTLLDNEVKKRLAEMETSEA